MQLTMSLGDLMVLCWQRLHKLLRNCKSYIFLFLLILHYSWNFFCLWLSEDVFEALIFMSIDWIFQLRMSDGHERSLDKID